jgi:hypothetical protein
MGVAYRGPWNMACALCGGSREPGVYARVGDGRRKSVCGGCKAQRGSLSGGRPAYLNRKVRKASLVGGA